MPSGVRRGRVGAGRTGASRRRRASCLRRRGCCGRHRPVKPKRYVVELHEKRAVSSVRRVQSPALVAHDVHAIDGATNVETEVGDGCRRHCVHDALPQLLRLKQKGALLRAAWVGVSVACGMQGRRDDDHRRMD